MPSKDKIALDLLRERVEQLHAGYRLLTMKLEELNRLLNDLSKELHRERTFRAIPCRASV